MSSLYPSAFIKKHAAPHIDLSRLPSTHELIKKETDQYGVGIYAQRPYARGTVIGHFLARQTSELRQHSLQRSPGDHLEDPYFVGYLLHSCDPNVVLDMHQQKVYCLKDIHEGEPLFMDYASTEDVLFRQFACACAAPNCRQWIAGRSEPVNQEGQHFLAEKERNLVRVNTAIHETRIAV